MGTSQGLSMTKRGLSGLLLLALSAVSLVVPATPAQAACTGNDIVCENQKPGTPQSEWDIVGAGDSTIQGFATAMSVNAGDPIQFKIDTDAHNYAIKIYRLGYYQGDGAREVASVQPSANLPQSQPSCATDPDTEIVDCGTWAVSASWNVPSSAVSGVYFARLIRSDTGGESHIPFVVRNDGNTSKALFQTSDTTWQAYNTYGGSNYYTGGPHGRAYKVSYNRPWSTRGWQSGRDFLFSNEYPMIRFLEQNGYDVSYVSGLDVHSDANLLTKHKAFLSVGHDEYWSKDQRDHVTAARDAGVNLAFFSGNEVYWKTRWEKSQDGTDTANRTLVCYKDTWANTQIDPQGPTATWRDPRFGDLGHGPENELTGTLYKANSVDLPITVDDVEGKMRLWRDTSLTTLASGTSVELAEHTVGYESNEDVDNGHRPAGLIRLSTTTGPTPEYLTDFGTTVAPGTTTHHITMYRAPSGALVFSAGSVQWAWGLDSEHDGPSGAADTRIQQATVNILADMDAPATTIATGLVAATKSTDTTAPTVTVTQPSSGATIPQGTLVTVKGTASDPGSGRVAGVEVSLDSGQSWHPAKGRGSFTYTGVLYGSGAGAIRVRAVDDSANLQASPAMIDIVSDCPCSLFGAATPGLPAAADSSAVTLGTRIVPKADGFITGVRFYKGQGNTGSHTGTLYSATGTVLATGTFSNELSTGWQILNFAQAVPVTAGTTYVAAYFAPNGHYSADQNFFASGDFQSAQLTGLGGPGKPNGVYLPGSGFPDRSFLSTNYYVDAVFNTTDDAPLLVTAMTPDSGATSVPIDDPISARFSKPVDPQSISFAMLNPANQVVGGSVSYDAPTRTATFTPTQSLAPTTEYSVTLTAEASAGAGLAAPVQWSFTTAVAPQPSGICPCTLFLDSDSPASTSTETDGLKLGVAFKPSVDGTITGVRFYKDASNLGTHTVSLWAAGQELATATVTNESTSGWQEGVFDAPVSVNANTTYVASYTAPGGHYSYTANQLSDPITRGPLSTIATGGRYTYGSGALTGTSATNYFVDPVFLKAATQAPDVAAISPGTKATSVPVGGSVKVTFDKAVQAGTATVTLKDPSGTSVPGQTTLETTGTTVTFLPSDALRSGTKYTVRVKDAVSQGGAAMTTDFVSTFTTSGADACPCSLMETTTVPPVADANDGSDVTLGLKFSPSVDGTVTGIRYYRSAANTGTHVGRLYTSSGNELASVTIPSQAAGWQTADFSTPVDVTADTTYVISYHAPNGHYAATLNYFDNPVINLPLSSVGSGSVYALGDNFPTNTYQRTNYYVDVIYESASDSPPTVVSTSPAAGSTGVAVSTKVKATFAKAIDPSTLAFTVTGPGTSPVTGGVAYDDTAKVATFTPAADLAEGTQFTVTVNATSPAGVTMASPKVWKFTTKSPPPTGTEHTLFAPDATPGVPSWDDNDAVAVGVKFSSSANGTVTAVKFYSGQGNTGTRTVTLWSSSGTQLGTGTSTSTEEGWRTVTLADPVQITAGQTYIASYWAPNGHYAATGGTFADPFANGPLSVPSGGAVYGYTNGFPSSTSNTNYWVDVVVVI